MMVRSHCFAFLSLLNTVLLVTAEPASLHEAEYTWHLLALDWLPDCAVRCVLESARDSGCSLRGVECLCPDENLNPDITACLLASCSVEDQLVTDKHTDYLCANPIMADDRIVPIFAIFISLTLVAVSLRILARALTGAYFWWDDLFTLFAMAGCIAFAAISISQVEHGFGMDIWLARHQYISLVLKLFYVDMLLYTITRFFVRSSILLFYLRVFPAQSETNLRPVIIWTLVANVIYNFAFLLAVIFQCQPISYFWNQLEEEDQEQSENDISNGSCGNVNALAWAAAVTGIAFDFWLLAMPFPQLMALHVHWRKKVMGGVMFGVGASVIIISLVRLKTINEFTRADNPTKNIVGVCMWSGIEIDMGVICPCLFSCRLLLRRMWPRLVGSSSNTTEHRKPSTAASGRGLSMRRRRRRRSTTLMSLWSSSSSTSRKGSGVKWNGSGEWYNSPGTGNIVKTTEVGVEVEPVCPTSPTSVASPSSGRGSITMVLGMDDSADGETLRQGIHRHG